MPPTCHRWTVTISSLSASRHHWAIWQQDNWIELESRRLSWTYTRDTGVTWSAPQPRNLCHGSAGQPRLRAGIAGQIWRSAISERSGSSAEPELRTDTDFPFLRETTAK